MRQTLVKQLADGRFHSGEHLAQLVGCSRAAIWKRLQKLADIPGLEVDAVRGRGYRFRRALSLLDREQIFQGLEMQSKTRLAACEVHEILDSTNEVAKSYQLNSRQPAAVVFGEYQTAGRGRRGREWISPYAHNLYFSIAHRFDLAMSDLAGLSLAAGVVLAEQLRVLGVPGVGLKWPNDLYCSGQKLGGILLEVSGEAAGPVTAIVGVGVNLAANASMHARINQPFTHLEAVGVVIDRSELATILVQALLDACERYANDGLKPFVERWRALDIHADQRVSLESAAGRICGIAKGIDESGGLLLDAGQGVQAHHAGEVSLRVEAST